MFICTCGNQELKIHNQKFEGKSEMNIYIGNLAYEITEEDLRTDFGEFGEVASVKIIKDKYTGRSKGFGFIEMPSEDEGQAAIEGLNGKEKNGRALKVNKARGQSEKRGGRGGFGRGEGNRGFGGGGVRGGGVRGGGRRF
jgi:RNA recognition motif-containing protein